MSARRISNRAAAIAGKAATCSLRAFAAALRTSHSSLHARKQLLQTALLHGMGQKSGQAKAKRALPAAICEVKAAENMAGKQQSQVKKQTPIGSTGTSVSMLAATSILASECETSHF